MRLLFCSPAPASRRQGTRRNMPRHRAKQLMPRYRVPLCYCAVMYSSISCGTIVPGIQMRYSTMSRVDPGLRADRARWHPALLLVALCFGRIRRPRVSQKSRCCFGATQFQKCVAPLAWILLLRSPAAGPGCKHEWSVIPVGAHHPLVHRRASQQRPQKGAGRPSATAPFWGRCS